MEVAVLKIFVASLYSSFIQCPTSNRDATLKNVQDDKAFLLTSNFCFRDNSSPQTYSRLHIQSLFLLLILFP